ncbi:P4HA [Lepeophtheirus salmonis]|uniref:P4HA n=1 Tax=Lepeophtheirus salmonis TaxID=72036 RepID=A0A7R8CWP6_LEPSM|nr:P4HA [Lepeophtheirus salmonis]CAF2924104.1 P4HA [Lepeophtheirus salmonis]
MRSKKSLVFLKKQRISSILPKSKIYHRDDLVGVTFALIRIQQAYELDPYDMAMGRLGTRQTNARLSAEELYEIVKILYYGSDRTYYSSGIEYALAITWLEGVIRLSFEDDLQDVFIEEIKTLLLEIQDEHDKHFQEPWTGQSLLQDMTSKEMRKLEKETVNKFSNQRSPWGRDFFSICRGEEQKWAKRASSSSSDQRCYVKHFSNPFLLLQPAKIEILNENPTLVQIHDVVPFSWIDKIKELSINKIVRAQVAADEGNKKSYDRTQSNACISKLFNDGSMVESETYQIGVYSPGGVYLPHMDTFNTDNELVNYENEFIGNRIATLMLYRVQQCMVSNGFQINGLDPMDKFSTDLVISKKARE